MPVHELYLNEIIQQILIGFWLLSHNMMSDQLIRVTGYISCWLVFSVSAGYHHMNACVCMCVFSC